MYIVPECQSVSQLLRCDLYRTQSLSNVYMYPGRLLCVVVVVVRVLSLTHTIDQIVQ